MPAAVTPTEQFIDIHFPRCGIDRSAGFSKQPNRPAGDGMYARTTHLGVNVRGFEAASNRARGGSRAGHSKYIATRVAGVSFVVQDLNLTAIVEPGASVQTSAAGRVVKVIAVSQGKVFTASPGDSAWAAATNSSGETPPLNYSGLVYSAANNLQMYFADGTNYVYYDPADDAVHPWVATAGQLPVDSDNNTPRLICTWRGRTVLSGLLNDPSNWFMSAQGEPGNFDYSPLTTTPTQAVAGNNAQLTGQVTDIVTALIPYSDDVLIFGGDHSIFVMRGDPMAGGQIDLVSDAIGIAWGQAWCKDPYGNVYFFSNRTGVYTLVPGQQPQRISQPVEQLLQQVNTGTHGIRMFWDDRFQMLHIFVTPLAAPAATTHFAYEQRSGAWWTDTFTDPNMDPLCGCVFDGNLPTDRVVLLGCWDGYVRTVDPAATDDDGVAIASSVVIGPVLTKDLDDVMWKDHQAVLGTGSGNVSFAVRVGSSAEAALSATPSATGTFVAGRNLSNLIRRAGHALYVTLSSTVAWSMESVRVTVAGRGKIRRRGR